ncbi:MAG: transposase, partial [Spirochaetia bacterium]|nr:transposase [Spirochaetia bacterium]
MIFLDTHAVVWLYQKELHLFSTEALVRLENETLLISPAVMLELDYLFEIGRITVNAVEIAEYLTETIGLEIDPVSFLPIVEKSLGLKWTRDPFDRLLTAHASFRQS